MDREWKAVKEFHRAFNHPIGEYPQALERDRGEKRYRWIKEELDEFLDALNQGDIVEQADAMIDTIYFALGTLVEMGIKPDPLFYIVQDANMSKIWPDGTPHYNADGKAIKPPDWIDPHSRLEKEIEIMRTKCE